MTFLQVVGPLEWWDLNRLIGSLEMFTLLQMEFAIQNEEVGKGEGGIEELNCRIQVHLNI